MAAAALHARGLVEQDPAALEEAAGRSSATMARAAALEMPAWHGPARRRGQRGDPAP